MHDGEGVGKRNVRGILCGMVATALVALILRLGGIVVGETLT